MGSVAIVLDYLEVPLVFLIAWKAQPLSVSSVLTEEQKIGDSLSLQETRLRKNQCTDPNLQILGEPEE
jgi:hypothetical protein